MLTDLLIDFINALARLAVLLDGVTWRDVAAGFTVGVFVVLFSLVLSLAYVELRSKW